MPVDNCPRVVKRVRTTFDLEDDDDRVVTEYTELGEEAIPGWVETFANVGEVI